MSGLVSDAVDGREITGVSRDEQVGVRMVGRTEGEFWIAPGHAERVGEQRLGEQFGQATAAMLVERARTIRRAKELTGSLAARRQRSERDQLLRESIAATTVELESPGGWVRIHAVGPEHVTFAVRSGAIATLGGDGVAAEASAAGRQALAAFLGEVRRLRREHYVAD